MRDILGMALAAVLVFLGLGCFQLWLLFAIKEGRPRDAAFSILAGCILLVTAYFLIAHSLDS